MATARLRIIVVAQDTDGDAYALATCKFYQPGTATASGSSTSGTPFAGSLYAAVSGGSPISTTQTLGSNGTLVVWTTSKSRVDVGIEPAGGGTAFVRQYEPAEFDPADLVTNDDLASAIKIGPTTSLLAVGTTVGTGEKGVQLGYDTTILADAATLQARDGTARTALALNPIAYNTDPHGNTVHFGAILPWFDGNQSDYVTVLHYYNNQQQWGGAFFAGESTNTSGTGPDDGGDVNVVKIVATVRTDNSNTRIRGLEMFTERFSDDGVGAPNRAITRGIDNTLMIDARAPANTAPWEYCGVWTMSVDSYLGYTSRQAGAAYYAGGEVDVGGTPEPGWEYGFYHDLRQPGTGVTPVPAFYSDYNGDIYVKRRIGVNTTSPDEALDVSSTTSGTPVRGIVQHNQASANSDASWWASAWPGGGDAYSRYTISATLDWSAGIDNSDSDAFKISKNATPGTNDYLKITSAGVVSLGPALGVTANATGLGIGLAPGEIFEASSGSSGTPSRGRISHTSNTANSDAAFWAQVAGSSGGDPHARFTINGVLDWVAGVDNSDGDRFKISKNSIPGTNDYLTLDTSGNVVVGSAALATNATDGFLYVESCAGAPSGAPTAYTGRVPHVVDTTNGRAYWYYGGAWHYATLT